MRPELGSKVYVIYGESILVDTVAFIGEDSFLISRCKNRYDRNEDEEMCEWEWYYREYDKEWFTNLEDAKKELLFQYKDEYKKTGADIRISKVGDHWEIEEI